MNMSFLVVRNLYIGIYIPFPCVQDGYQHHYMVFILGLIRKNLGYLFFCSEDSQNNGQLIERIPK